MSNKRNSLQIVAFINSNSLDDLASISELCKDGWIIHLIKESNETTLPNHNTKVLLIKHLPKQL